MSKSDKVQRLQVGDKVVISGIEKDNRCIDFNGELVEVMAITEIAGSDVVTFYNSIEGYGALSVGDHFKRPETALRDEIAKEIDAESKDYANVFGVIERIIAAGYGNKKPH